MEAKKPTSLTTYGQAQEKGAEEQGRWHRVQSPVCGHHRLEARCPLQLSCRGKKRQETRKQVWRDRPYWGGSVNKWYTQLHLGSHMYR